MTTRLSKPVTRVVDICGQEWNVTLGVNGITFRRFRLRQGYLLPYGPAMVRAVTMHVEQQRREKAKKRKIRRGA